MKLFKFVVEDRCMLLVLEVSREAARSRVVAWLATTPFGSGWLDEATVTEWSVESSAPEIVASAFFLK